jgi:hypothetical protein
MTVSAEYHAFIELFMDSLPASRASTAGNTEVLQGRVEMMKLQRLDTPVIAANTASAALIFNGSRPYGAAPLLNSLNQILAAVHISPCITFATHVFSHSHLLYRLSYRGVIVYCG